MPTEPMDVIVRLHEDGVRLVVEIPGHDVSDKLPAARRQHLRDDDSVNRTDERP
jgi:hypothetical protein